MTQPRGPEDVQAALDERGLDIQVQRHAESTATSEEAAAAAGCELGQIAKSLCFTVADQPVLVIAAGDQRVDTRKIARMYNVGRKKVKMTDPETTVEVTGYAPGGVPPLGLATDLPIYIDQTLGRFDLIYGAAGAPNAIFPVPFDVLVEATGGQVVDISQD